MVKPTSLTPELEEIRKKIEKYARGYGLDFFETIFELVDFEKINQIASYGGFPTRYPHWRFGMEYERMSKSYSYGLSKIYEMVINNDPCYAYLLNANYLVDQKLVMAHVFGHCDFFKNNYWFSKTNRKMMDEMANHSTRVRKYIEKYGEDVVEEFIDVALSLENLIDYYSPFIKRVEDAPKKVNMIDQIEGENEQIDYKMKSKPYMDKYINPKEFVDKQRDDEKKEKEKKKNFPPEPVRDILDFLVKYAPLEDWKADVLSIIREEAYYFSPQGQTKIMNEGWASYWHSKIMTEKALDGDELIDYADHHSGTLATQPGSLNPYKLGIELYRDIEDRWNKGKFGKEYDECEDFREKKHWDKKLGLGREKIFEVRKIHNDVTFIDNFLTEEFCHEHKMFLYGYNRNTGRYEITDRKFSEVKKQLLFNLTNFGQPMIYVEDGNYDNKGEVMIWHKHEGSDLKVDYAKATIENIFKVWKRPVNLRTIMDGKNKYYRFDGSEHSEKT
ncbi:MAG: SpoVR family protein [Candidatus Sericytochromatia bacterium]